MGHFIIDLSENKKGDVRWGTMNKMQFSLFRKRKLESKRGYIVQVSDDKDKLEYRLFKSPEGEWSKDPEGKLRIDDDVLLQVKLAIIEREKQLNLH